MNNCVCIPTAGIGSRLGSLKKGLNKSLINLGGKPVLSHIIEKFNHDSEFIIPIGFGGNLVKEFIALAYPGYNIKFVEIDKFEGSGSGLGYTLKQTKEYLQKPFYFISCDTLVIQEIPRLKYNWIGYSVKTDSNQYRTIKKDGNLVKCINKKNSVDATNDVYIGLAFVNDHEVFWKNFENDKDFISEGEVSGLNKLVNCKLYAKEFEWFDTGNTKELELTKKIYAKDNKYNILEKKNEEIWFVNKRVIKYSVDKSFIKNRVSRSVFLNNFVPRVIDSTSNMYCYEKMEGNVFSKIISNKLFDDLLDYSKTFWKKEELNKNEKMKFKNICYKFYKEKTLDRIKSLFVKYPSLGKVKYINNTKVNSLKNLLLNINWNYLSDGEIGRFHGDFHFENILYEEKQKKFTFLDWRQDFGGDIYFGDIYYDFAKLMHGIIIDHEIIIRNKYDVTFRKDNLNFNFDRKFLHIECEKRFKDWLKLNNYNTSKVYLITALIYLNISTLHHYPYDHLLYGIGHYMLNQESNSF